MSYVFMPKKVLVNKCMNLDRITEHGHNLWVNVSVHQNNIINKYGNIPPNNDIWNKFLNRWDSYDYACIVIFLEELLEIKPELFESYHIDTIEKLKEHLLTETDSFYLLKNKKKLIWKLIMFMKEIYNEVNNIPNTIVCLTPDHQS